MLRSSRWTCTVEPPSGSTFTKIRNEAVFRLLDAPDGTKICRRSLEERSGDDGPLLATTPLGVIVTFHWIYSVTF